jgi:hypothetical protein
MGSEANLDVIVSPSGDSGDLLLGEEDGVLEVVVHHGSGLERERRQGNGIRGRVVRAGRQVRQLRREREAKKTHDWVESGKDADDVGAEEMKTSKVHQDIEESAAGSALKREEEKRKSDRQLWL